MKFLEEHLSKRSTRCRLLCNNIKDSVDDKQVFELVSSLDIIEREPNLYKQTMFNIHGKQLTDIDLIPTSLEIAFKKLWDNQVTTILSSTFESLRDVEDTTWHFKYDLRSASHLEERSMVDVFYHGLGRSVMCVAMLMDTKAIRHDEARKMITELTETGRSWITIEDHFDNGVFDWLNDVQSASEMDTAIDAVLAENAKIIEQIKNGNTKAIGSLIGAVMKKYKGDPREVRAALELKL